MSFMRTEVWGLEQISELENVFQIYLVQARVLLR